VPYLEQTAYASVAKYESRNATVTFPKATKPGSLIVVVEACAGALPVGLREPTNFTRIGINGLRDIEMGVWYRQNAPATTQVAAGYLPLTMRSIQLWAFEISGIHLSNALDKVVINSGESDTIYAPSTGITSQADELVMGFLVNQYDTAVQYGFQGSLAKLVETTSPQKWSGGSNVDWERSRISVWQAMPTTAQSFSHLCRLSTTRRWLTILCTFRGGSLGPARMTSTNADPVITTDGVGSLTMFGPLKATTDEPPVLQTGGSGRIGPSYYQYRLGGWGGLLIGSTTEFHVEGTDGLNGWQVRTSDDDLPRGDGSLRGIDLETSRQVVFSMNVGKGRDEVERNMDTLYRALVPQRDEDWELLWRHPTGHLKMMRVRPIDILRERSAKQLTFASQKFALRAADPRHYAAIPSEVAVPVTVGLGDPLITQVINEGNAPAYPVITIHGPSSGVPVSRVELVNETGLVTFSAELVLPKGSTLVADMDARITGAPRSVITLDGQTRYGAWSLPRDPFRIEPDPTGFGGYNEIYLRTTPAGAPVKCTLTYRHTWAG